MGHGGGSWRTYEHESGHTCTWFVPWIWHMVALVNRLDSSGKFIHMCMVSLSLQEVKPML